MKSPVRRSVALAALVLSSLTTAAPAQTTGPTFDDEAEIDEAVQGPGLRSWFHDVAQAKEGHAAAFDTRFDKPAAFTGSAARGIARRLRHHGYHLAVEPESFFVEDAEGPLADGEVDRARAWGSTLAGMVAPAGEGVD